MSTDARPDLPKWLWLYAPFALLVVQVAARLGGDETYVRWMRGEISVPELGTVSWLVLAVVGGLTIVTRRARLVPAWLSAWMLLFTLGCAFFAGEEASWGQHYFGWRTPEALAAANDQKETNIHNLSGIGALFDQAPRALLTLGAIATVVIALWRKRRPQTFGPATRWHWIWPTAVCVPAAVLALTISPLEKLAHAFGGGVANVFDLQQGEFKEYFLAMFLALYAWSLCWRLQPAPRVSHGPMT